VIKKSEERGGHGQRWVAAKQEKKITGYLSPGLEQLPCEAESSLESSAKVNYAFMTQKGR